MGGGQRQQWGAPPQQQWGQPTASWNAPIGVQNQPRGGSPYGPVMQPQRSRGGSSSALKLMLLSIGAILLGMVLFSMLSTTDEPITVPPGDYQNEDYRVPPVDQNPPELPSPQTYGEATQWLIDNPIYRTEIAKPVRCEAAPINLREASKAQLQEHFNELTGCLMRVFGPALEEAGFIPVRPSVTIYSSSVQTRCGTMPLQNAAYCAADQQVYYAADLPSIIPPDLQNVNYVVESVIAHEFAHAIQARTGILISEAAWEQNSQTEAQANDFSRRLEVQADCWSGEFINSVGQSVSIDQAGIDQLSLLFYSIGDDVLTGRPNIDGNHGHGGSRRSWFLDGAASTNMGTCNAFAAPADRVR